MITDQRMICLTIEDFVAILSATAIGREEALREYIGSLKVASSSREVSVGRLRELVDSAFDFNEPSRVAPMYIGRAVAAGLGFRVKED